MRLNTIRDGPDSSGGTLRNCAPETGSLASASAVALNELISSNPHNRTAGVRRVRVHAHERAMQMHVREINRRLSETN